MYKSKRTYRKSKAILLICQLLYSINQVFKSSPWIFIISIFITILNTLSTYFILYFGKEIINKIDYVLRFNISYTNAIYIVGFWVLLTAITSLILIIINYIDSILKSKQQLKFNQYIDYEMSKKCIELDASYFDDSHFYDQIAEAQRGKDHIGFIFYRSSIFISNLVSLIIAIVLSINSSNYIFPILIILFSIPPFITNGKLNYLQFDYANKYQNLLRKISYLANIILGKNTAKEIRFYDMADFVTNKYTINWNNFIKGKKELIFRLGIIDSMLSSIPFIGIAISIYFLILNIINGNNEIGDFAYLLAIYTNIQVMFSNIIKDIAKLQESAYALEKYNNFIGLKSNIISNGNIIIDKINIIEFKNVYFAYPNNDNNVINNLSFKINKNEKVAIIGINGAGKTTIVKLILRFYDVTKGEILINDINIKELDVLSLRNNFSTVFQDFITYSLTIRENIAISDFENRNKDSDIIDALKLSDCDDFIQNNLDKHISKDFYEEGIELSGGQKQKLAIARCAFKKGNFIILDEPTASLDPLSEFNILESFKKLYKNCGLIMISHRLSNTKLMDKILVIENGELIETGSHYELMNKCGRYSELFKLQSEKYILE